MRTRHLDDFALLRFTAGDMDTSERNTVEHHLDQCEACLLTLAEIRPLNGELRRIGAARADSAGSGTELPAGDPFRVRPEAAPGRAARFVPHLVDQAVAASDHGRADVETLLDATREQHSLADALGGLSLSEPAARYLLLYALEEAGSRITVDGPTRPLRFVEAVLRRLEGAPTRDGPAETMVPLGAIAAQAHVLAGQACNWTGALEKAGEHLETAFRTFAESGDAGEGRLALTEYHESQRRSFAGRPSEGVLLARRAGATFERLGLDDYVARSRVAEGIALSYLGRETEALACYRAALPVFERGRFWRNYVSAVNGLGASLARLGLLAEARREYSHALRRLARGEHPSLLAFTRNGLAHVLFFSESYAEAAKSFLQAARTFDRLELVADALTASLWEIESWARSGDTARALHRLQLFRTVVERNGALDPFIVRQLEESLSGRDPDFERLAEIRGRAQETLRGRLRAEAG